MQHIDARTEAEPSAVLRVVHSRCVAALGAVVSPKRQVTHRRMKTLVDRIACPDGPAAGSDGGGKRRSGHDALFCRLSLPFD